MHRTLSPTHRESFREPLKLTHLVSLDEFNSDPYLLSINCWITQFQSAAGAHLLTQNKWYGRPFLDRLLVPRVFNSRSGSRLRSSSLPSLTPRVEHCRDAREFGAFYETLSQWSLVFQRQWPDGRRTNNWVSCLAAPVFPNKTLGMLCPRHALP
jgi:hypothetical protein